MKGDVPIVYLVDDDAAVRSSISRLLRVAGFQFSCFTCAEEFLKVKSFKRPACAILDVQMPGLNGLQLQDQIEKKGIHIPIVFITGHGHVPMSVQAMKKGAVDFLPKPFTNEALLQSVNQAIAQDRVFIQKHRETVRVQSRLRLLSERETQVFHGVISGLLNKQIAVKMGIKEKTVKVHRAAVMSKMKATSVAHLVRLAEVVGIVGSQN